MKKEPDDPIEYFFEKGEQLTWSIARSMSRTGKVTEGILKSVGYNTLVVMFLLFTSFVLLLLVSPILITSENYSLRGVGAVMYNFVSFSGMCHQLPQRSIRFLGAHMAVDARDFAIYSGIVVGGILLLVTERGPKILRSPWILLTIIPIAVDGISQTILALRESSNLLRLLTGFIFGFGFTCFFVSYLFRKYTDFKPSITKKENLIVTVFATLFLVYLFVSSVGEAAGKTYLSKKDAVALTLNSSETSWNYAKAYYVAPRVVTSIHYDPYLESYNDFVLKDVKDLDWDRLEILADETGSRVMGLTGLWAVVLSNEKPGGKGKTVFTHVSGEYYYIDPVQDIILEVKTH